MDLKAITIMAYVMLLSFFTPDILTLPSNIAKRRINQRGIFGRKVSIGRGLALTFLLSVMGMGLWFSLCMVPVAFAKGLNARYGLIVWFGIPFCFGALIRALLSRLRT